MEKIKVAIVDDSAFMRKIIRDSLESRGFDVVAIGRNGADAVDIASKNIANVMTLDVQMPIMNGLEALKKIMKNTPMPIIMVSSITTEDAEITVDALKNGAFDFIAKPGGAITFDFSEVIDDLTEKLILASKANLIPKIVEHHVIKSITSKKTYDLLFIGSSTGGPKALDLVIPEFPRDFPIPIIIIQHMPAHFTSTLAKRLSDESKIKVQEVTELTMARPSNAYVAAGDFHMEVIEDSGIYLKPVEGPKINGVRPAIDYTLSSIAKTRLRILCVILTGMGKDGSEGIKLIKKENLTVIAESEKTAIVYGMPGAAVSTGLVNYVLDLNDIPSKIMELMSTTLS